MICIRLLTIHGIPLKRQVVKLRKSLYSLRQAPQLWHNMLSKVLQKFGFKCSTPRDSLYMLLSSDTLVIILYIDDVLVMGSEEEIGKPVKKLATVFNITDRGRLSYFLAVKFDFRQNGVFLLKSGYILKIIDISNMLTAKQKKQPLR